MIPLTTGTERPKLRPFCRKGLARRGTLVYHRSYKMNVSHRHIKYIFTTLIKIKNLGEDDSHLLKVMRAYHLSKVKNPSDLPDWLFSARERGGKGSFAQTERSEEPVEQPMTSDRTQKQRRRQGQVSQPVPPVPLGSFSTDNGTTFSKGPSEAMTRRRPDGIERLKTLREQRRGQDIPRRF